MVLREAKLNLTDMSSPMARGSMANCTRSIVDSSILRSLERPSLRFPCQVVAGQRRSITIKQLEAAKNGKLIALIAIAPLASNILTTSTSRPRTSRHPRLRLGRLQSRPQPQPQEVPNRRRLPTLLLRLHTPPSLHLRGDPRIPYRSRTRPLPHLQIRLHPRPRRWRRLWQQRDHGA